MVWPDDDRHFGTAHAIVRRDRWRRIARYHRRGASCRAFLLGCASLLAIAAAIVLGGPGRAAAGARVAAVVDDEDNLDTRVRELLDEGDYAGAMRVLPAALAQWDRENLAAGHSHDDARGFLLCYTLRVVAATGDAHWGVIFDDLTIGREWKLSLLGEIQGTRIAPQER